MFSVRFFPTSGRFVLGSSVKPKTLRVGLLRFTALLIAEYLHQ